MTPVLVAITQGANLVTTFGPIGIGLALQLRKAFQGFSDSGEPFEVQIQQKRGGVIVTLDHNDELIAEWLKDHPEHA